MYGEMMYKKLRRRQKGGAPSSKLDNQLTRFDSLDYLFRLAVEMKRLGLPWVA